MLKTILKGTTMPKDFHAVQFAHNSKLTNVCREENIKVAVVLREELFQSFHRGAIERWKEFANLGQLFKTMIDEESECFSQHIVFISTQRCRLPRTFQLFDDR